MEFRRVRSDENQPVIISLFSSAVRLKWGLIFVGISKSVYTLGRRSVVYMKVISSMTRRILYPQPVVKGRGYPYEKDTEKIRPPGGAALGCGLMKDALSRGLCIRFALTLFGLSDARLWDDVVLHTQLQMTLSFNATLSILLAQGPHVLL